MPRWDGTDKEADVENHLVKRVKGVGGRCYKFKSPSQNSVHDRICLFPSDYRLPPVFVELKAPGEPPTELQKQTHKWFEEQGYLSYVIDTREGVDAFMMEMETKRLFL